MIPEHYQQELEDGVFRFGESKGRVTTSLSILTDSLLMLNALELYYQKPVSKAVAPREIEELRANLTSVKELLRQAMDQLGAEGDPG